MEFSHIGIPAKEERDWDGFCEPNQFHYTDFAKDEFNIEWVKFDADSEAHEMVKTMPHLSCRVENIEEALAGREQLGEIFTPAEGVRVVYINHNGGVVEFLELKE